MRRQLGLNDGIWYDQSPELTVRLEEGSVMIAFDDMETPSWATGCLIYRDDVLVGAGIRSPFVDRLPAGRTECRYTARWFSKKTNQAGPPSPEHQISTTGLSQAA